MSTAELFTRLCEVHRPNCAVFDGGVLPVSAPKPETLAVTLGSDAAAQYAQDCRAVYEDLRRIIGQLAGLAILAQLTGITDVADLAELDGCHSRWQQARDRIGSLTSPSLLAAHLEQITAAHAFSGHALKSFSYLRRNADNDAIFDTIVRHIRRAYAHLSAASSEKAGLEMVDFAQACCSCGR